MSSARFRSAFLATFFLLAVLAAPGHPQQHSTLSNPSVTPQQPGFPDHRDRQTDETAVMLEQRQAHARNDERQKRLVADTEKLLVLATQLHNDVGKTDKNILSLDVVRRADEIERLAHSVKERMKG